MLVHPSLPVRTVAEFIAYVKARPADVDHGFHWRRQLAAFERDAVHHDDGCGRAHQTLRRRRPGFEGHAQRRAQMMFEPMSASHRTGEERQAARAGREHCYALEQSARDPRSDRGAARLRGQRSHRHRCAARHTSDIVARLNREVNAAFADAATRSRLDESGGAVLPGSSTEFEAMLAGEIETMGQGDPVFRRQVAAHLMGTVKLPS